MLVSCTWCCTTPDFVDCFQDDFAVQSYEKAIAANNSGAFKWEIVPVIRSTLHLRIA